MKNQLFKNLFMAGVVAFSVPALADSGNYGDGKSRFMSFFDTNGDNVVTTDEFNDAVAKRFDVMDADKNGTVSREEFQSFVAKKRDERHDKKFMSMDSNNDDQVSREEYLSYKQTRAEERFQGMDTNNDGVISKEEFDARKSQWHGHNYYGHHGDGKDKGKIFDKLDGNKDGQLTRQESVTAWTNWFKRLDANGDQQVTGEEVREFRSKKMDSWK
ncbi:MAG TPA: EF-hand domain-containing protein [Gammaproteobacteria bacterium]